MQSVKLLGGQTPDGTKTSEGLTFFLFWKMMTSQENQEKVIDENTRCSSILTDIDSVN